MRRRGLHGRSCRPWLPSCSTAALQGLCEVIERDAVTMWELGGLEHQARSRIALSTVADPAATALLERFLRAGLRVGLWNLTSAVGVTVVQAAVVAADPDAVPGPGGAEPNAGELARELIEKIGEDAEFRELLIHDSDAALEQAGLSERVNQLTDDVMNEADDEVSGFASFTLGVSAPTVSIGGARPGPTWIIAQSSCSCSCGCGSFSRGC